MLRPYSCQLLVGGKHLEDKLSVIAKNSSPNASPVQLSVVRKKGEEEDNFSPTPLLALLPLLPYSPYSPYLPSWGIISVTTLRPELPPLTTIFSVSKLPTAVSPWKVNFGSI
jgi:hypothetical protein